MRYSVFLAFLSLQYGSLQAVTKNSDTIDATAIVTKIQNILSPENFTAKYRFTNHRLDGTVTTYVVRFQSLNPTTSHGMFLEPKAEQGRELLRTDDSIWTYMPSIGRAMRIADRDSFAGGDFSNADVLRVDWTKRYKMELLKTSPKQWIVGMTAAHPDANYNAMRLWVRRDNGQPVQQNFYDAKGTLLKQLRYGAIKSFGTITRPARLLMINRISGQKSELDVLEFSLTPHLPQQRFLVENLGK